LYDSIDDQIIVFLAGECSN